MPLTSVYLAEEAISLPPEQRETLAKLLLENLAGNNKTDAEIQAQLRTRLGNLKSGRDRGLGFDEVFGEKAD